MKTFWDILGILFCADWLLLIYMDRPFEEKTYTVAIVILSAIESNHIKTKELIRTNTK